ncbi:uncharacterized protein [Cherax quadricarinatus]|uniref:uncharacterized protein n=1 Tax=Cherax quadricarinatus TaxID=27406 RepID=UPI00387E8DD8
MCLAAWMFLTIITWCSYAHAAPAPPMAAALSQPNHIFGSSKKLDNSIDLPEKELQRFFFPGSQAMMENVDDLYHLSEPDSNKGYSGRNYLRFGRSIDRHINSTPSRLVKRDVSAVHNAKSPESGEITFQRMKRGTPSMYMSLPPHSPFAWARDIRPEEETFNVASSEDSQDVNKRGYMNFLRFGNCQDEV